MSEQNKRQIKRSRPSFVWPIILVILGVIFLLSNLGYMKENFWDNIWRLWPLILIAFGFTVHIRSRGEEAKELAKEAGKRARRWVVERTHSWMNRFRRILIRWEKKSQNYIAFLHFACALIAFRAAGLFG